MLEFRHLKLHAPAGVYILPSFDSLREWSGVLFVRSGVYKGGLFRFSMQLPRSYPANGACPRVLFQSRVFHPHVHPQTGQVDILSHFGGHWVAGEHYIVLVLQVLKSMMHVTPQKDLSLRVVALRGELVRDVPRRWPGARRVVLPTTGTAAGAPALPWHRVARGYYY